MRGKGAGRGARRDGRTASAIVLRPILSYGATRGVDARALLAEVGVPPSALHDPDYRIPDEIHARVWREAGARSGDPFFGLHVAEHNPVGTYDALDYALRYSESLHDAFTRMSKFYRLLCDSLATAVDPRPGAARVQRTVPATTARPRSASSPSSSGARVSSPATIYPSARSRSRTPLRGTRRRWRRSSAARSGSGARPRSSPSTPATSAGRSRSRPRAS